MRTDAEYKLNRELEEHQVFLKQLADVADGDEDLLRDLIEGETDILELIQKLDDQIIENEMVADGVDKQMEKLKKRKTAAENRIVRMKDAVKHAMVLAELPKHRVADGAQWIIGDSPLKAIVLDESLVPSKWWKDQDPKVDQGGLTTYFRDAKKAREAAAKNKDEGARQIALAAALAEFPDIPGVTSSAGATQISRR